MVEAIFSFLCSILISLGGSVTADNIGQDFATIYSNQDPSVQQKMDEYFYGNPGTQLQQDIFFQGTKLTTEMLYNIQNGNVWVQLEICTNISVLTSIMTLSKSDLPTIPTSMLLLILHFVKMYYKLFAAAQSWQ